MKQDWDHQIRLLIYSALILTIIGSVFLLVKLSPHLSIIWSIFKAVFIPFLISVILAYLLNPVVTLLNNRKVPRGMAVVLIYFSFSLFFAIFLLNAIPVFIREARDLTEHVPELIQTYQRWLHEINTHKYYLPSGARTAIDQFLISAEGRTSQFFSSLLNGATGIFQKIIHFLVIPFLVFYLLKDMKFIQKGCLLLVPRKHRRTCAKLFHDIDEALGSYIRGQLLVCAVVGVLAYIGYLIIGMPYALVLALIIGITNIIPFIGPLIGAAPSILVAATISGKMTLLVLAVNFIVQILEGNIVSPLVMGRTLHIHPLVIILALLLGGELGGLVGLIFAVPIAAILRVVLHHAALHFVKR